MAELFLTKATNEPIEANLLTPNNAAAVALWCGGVLVEEQDALNHEDKYVAINVPTAHGMKRAQEGTWIVRKPTGDFDTMSPPEFSQLFIPARDQRHG